MVREKLTFINQILGVLRNHLNDVIGTSLGNMFCTIVSEQSLKFFLAQPAALQNQMLPS